jgi:hypothetical protein
MIAINRTTVLDGPKGQLRAAVLPAPAGVRPGELACLLRIAPRFARHADSTCLRRPPLSAPMVAGEDILTIDAAPLVVPDATCRSSRAGRGKSSFKGTYE